MDRRLLEYYNRELTHLRESGAEFARQFPKIAGRLALEEFTCADPYVERLLEGFAYLAARVQLKLDAEFPRFTQGLIETVLPHYLAPTPSMAVAQFQPTAGDSTLVDGVKIARDSSVRSMPGKGDVPACEFRTAHDVTLWPVQVAEARYFARDLATLGLPPADDLGVSAKAAIRLRLATTAEVNFDKLLLDALPLYLRAAPDLQMRVYEHVFRHASGVAVLPTSRPAKWCQILPASAVRQVGFDDEQALLPVGPRSFTGYRLLHEYFAFPQRFMFLELAGLNPGLRRCNARTVDVIILLRESNLALENALEAGHFVPFCSPIVNLFPKRCDRIHLSERFSELHVVPDRTRPKDFEVYSISSVTAFGARPDEEQPFLPFYSRRDFETRFGAYYTVHRVPRVHSQREERFGPRTRYDGSEVFLALVDAAAAPYKDDLRQLAVEAVCTNRDLPMLLPTGGGGTDFTLDGGATLEWIRSVTGVPTAPRPSSAEGEYAWRLISHLSLNYLSLANSDGGKGAAALRELLQLYGDFSEAAVKKQIAGVKSVASKPRVERLSGGGPIAFVRGLEIALTFDEASFEGTGAFLLGAVLERFFAKYVSLNSFTKTVVRTVDRGEIMSWPARYGLRQIL